MESQWLIIGFNFQMISSKVLHTTINSNIGHLIHTFPNQMGELKRQYKQSKSNQKVEHDGKDPYLAVPKHTNIK